VTSIEGSELEEPRVNELETEAALAEPDAEDIPSVGPEPADEPVADLEAECIPVTEPESEPEGLVDCQPEPFYEDCGDIPPNEPARETADVSVPSAGAS